MATYTYKGRKFKASDDMPVERVLELAKQYHETQGANLVAAGTSKEVSAAPTSSTTDPDRLQYDPNWLDSSRKLWDYNNSKPFEGSDADLAEYGLDQMGWFNYNIPRMGVDAYRISQAPEDTKLAFVHLMDTYDNLEMSWGGFGRFIKGVATDPTTYTGLATFGIGTAAGQATKVASKQALKEMLKVGVVTGAEGAFWSGASNAITQNVKIDAGVQDEFSTGDLAKSAGLGVAVGGALGAAGSAVGTALRKAPADNLVPPQAVPAPTQAAPSPAQVAPSPTQVAPSPTQAAPSPTQAAQAAPANPASPAAPTGQTPAGAAPNPSTAAPNPSATGPTIGPTAPSHANKIIEAVQRHAANSGMRIYPRTIDGLSDAASEATNTIRHLTPADIHNAIEEARRADVTGEQALLLNKAFADTTDILLRDVADLQAQAMDKTKTKLEVAAIRQEIRKVSELLDAVRPADLDASSMSGLDLGARRGLINTGDFRTKSVDSILEEWGVTPSRATPQERQDAEVKFAELVWRAREKVDASEQIRGIDRQIDEAFNSGDTAKALQLQAQKDILATKLIDDDPDNFSQTMSKAGGTTMRFLNEYLISTVFTPKTIAVNTFPHVVKSVFKPATDYIIKGMDVKAYKEMAATYGAMVSHSKMAWRAAVASFRYERDLLTNGADKFLEHAPVVPKRYGGGVLRFFPRVISATDQLFGRLNYAGYIAAQATGDAYEEAVKLGLKGKAMDDFMEKRVKAAAEQAYESKPDAPTVIQMLRQEAVNRGMSPGPKMDAWVTQELHKNADLFKKATNETGKSFVDDMAFKRKFDGKNKASELASGYENFVNKNPWMRVVGQLFFRTPVRVFEEGIRLTPGLQLVAPNFIRDLSGKGRGGRGGYAQVRAQGEMMMSYALAMSAMAMYANGSLTGGGLSDWKANRTQQDDPNWSPYTIRFGDGYEFNFRNLDPFSTPFKIIANSLDRLVILQAKHAQGEAVPQSAFSEVASYLAVGALSAVQAVKDASLTDGISQLVTMAEDLTDPDTEGSAVARWFAQKAAMGVPNVVNKFMSQLDPVIANPVSLEQHIRGKINPADPKVPKRYDVMGFPMKYDNPLAMLHGVDISQPKSQMDKKRAEVLTAIAGLTAVTEKSFMAPFDAAAYAGIPSLTAHLKGVDIRTQYTKDGKETWHDRLNRYASETGMIDVLHNVLVVHPAGTIGSNAVDGTRVELVDKLLKQARTQAFLKLYASETGMAEESLKAKLGIANIKAGNAEPKFRAFQ
jgi:hypothetical protein